MPGRDFGEPAVTPLPKRAAIAREVVLMAVSRTDEHDEVAAALDRLGLQPRIRHDIAFTDADEHRYRDRRGFRRHGSGSDHVKTTGRRGPRTPFGKRFLQSGGRS